MQVPKQTLWMQLLLVQLQAVCGAVANPGDGFDISLLLRFLKVSWASVSFFGLFAIAVTPPANADDREVWHSANRIIEPLGASPTSSSFTFRFRNKLEFFLADIFCAA